MAAELHIGDVGTVLEATIRDENNGLVDISSASAKKLLLKKPDGTVIERPATLSGSGVDGKMRYVTVAGDLDRAGQWTIQGYVEIGSGKWHTDMQLTRVYPNLD